MQLLTGDSYVKCNLLLAKCVCGFALVSAMMSVIDIFDFQDRIKMTNYFTAQLQLYN